MSGLVYRELFLGRKSLRTAAILYTAVLAMCVLAKMSLLWGNLANTSAETFTSVEKTFYYICLYMPALMLAFTLAGESGVIYADFQTGWHRFVFSSPLTVREWMGVKLKLKAVLLGIAAALSLLSAGVACLLFGKPLTIGILANLMCILLLAAVAAAAMLPSAVKHRSAVKVSRRLTAVMMSAYAVVCIAGLIGLQRFSAAHPEYNDDDSIEAFLVWLLPYIRPVRNVLAVAALVLIPALFWYCYQKSVKILERRDP